MRLSDIPADRALDVVADLVGPIGRIASDDEMRRRVRDAMEGAEGTASQVAAVAPLILKGHGDDVLEVLAITNGVTVEEYVGARRLPQVMQDLIDLLSDEDAAAFLPSATATTGEG